MIYFSVIDELEEYSDEEVGQLFRALLAFCVNGSEPDFTDRGMRTMWRKLQRDAEADSARYDRKVEKTRLSAVYGRYKARAEKSGVEVLPFDVWADEYQSQANVERLSAQASERTPIASPIPVPTPTPITVSTPTSTPNPGLRMASAAEPPDDDLFNTLRNSRIAQLEEFGR